MRGYVLNVRYGDMQLTQTAWHLKTIKNDRPFVAHHVWLICGRNLRDYFYCEKDVRDVEMDKVGEKILAAPLLGSLKHKDDTPAADPKEVFMQDFSESWTDEKLYAKYGITKSEQKFIESLIKPME